VWARRPALWNAVNFRALRPHIKFSSGLSGLSGLSRPSGLSGLPRALGPGLSVQSFYPGLYIFVTEVQDGPPDICPPGPRVCRLVACWTNPLATRLRVCLVLPHTCHVMPTKTSSGTKKAVRTEAACGFWLAPLWIRNSAYITGPKARAISQITKPTR
jgi:hypothetical protein